MILYGDPKSVILYGDPTSVILYVWTDLKTQSTLSPSKQVRPQGTVSYGGPAIIIGFLCAPFLPDLKIVIV